MSESLPSFDSVLAVVETPKTEDSTSNEADYAKPPALTSAIPDRLLAPLASPPPRLQPFAYDVPRSTEHSQKVEALHHTLDRHRGDRQLIVLQDFPDPDALASGWTYKLIAQKYDIQTDMVYAGTLSHQENIALVKLTSLPANAGHYKP
jgi:hypothetical protein